MRPFMLGGHALHTVLPYSYNVFSEPQAVVRPTMELVKKNQKCMQYAYRELNYCRNETHPELGFESKNNEPTQQLVHQHREESKSSDHNNQMSIQA